MDMAILQALVKNQLAQIALARTNEVTTRNAISGDGLDTLIGNLFPGVQGEMLDSNKNVTNHLQAGVNRYTRALTRGELNWEWEGDGEAPPIGDPGVLLTGPGRDLVQSLVVDALVSGKVAVFPYIDLQGRLRLSCLNGFLWPIFEEGNSNHVEALLQITASMVDGKTVFQVRRFSPGMLDVFSGLEDWQTYATQTPVQYPQNHAPDRLPVAFRIAGRDANRNPEGLAQAAMPSFLRYLKASVLLAFIAHRGGFEERVVHSDKLFDLALTDPRNKMLQDMVKVGPNKVRLGGSGDKYDRLPPVPLADYSKAERDAKADLRDALNMPDTDGSDLSGDALAEKREAYTETTDALAALMADAFTEAHELASLLSPATVKAGWKVTLSPKFSRDMVAERKDIREDYKSGILPKSAALSGLQGLGVSYVTDEQIQLAQEAEGAANVPTLNGGG